MPDGSAYEAELSPFVAPLEHGPSRLLAAIGDARFVCLGEASHGSAELYRERARLTEILLAEKGFDAVAIEADWPDAHRVHRFVQGRSEDTSPEEALRGFTRFPMWMWRNREVTDFLARLAARDLRPGIFGLDLYSLHASIHVVLTHLKSADPEAYERARARYACFDHYGDTTQYGYAAGLGMNGTCEQQVAQQLVELQSRALEAARRDVDGDEDTLFQIEMNARLVRDAESYYRNMIAGSVVTWNLRDRHMADTLAQVVQHLDRKLGRPCKVVLWAHNSHLGDARATQMGDEGELNVGQLLRERYGRDAFLVGFTTNDGTVTAANEWEAPPQRMRVNPALPESHEGLLHKLAVRTGMKDFFVLPDDLDGEARLPAILRKTRLERAIGVIYRPRTERVSHYFRARLADQFDALLHVDRTSAVEPLDSWSELSTEDEPETFPFAV